MLAFCAAPPAIAMVKQEDDQRHVETSIPAPQIKSSLTSVTDPVHQYILEWRSFMPLTNKDALTLVSRFTLFEANQHQERLERAKELYGTTSSTSNRLSFDILDKLFNQMSLQTLQNRQKTTEKLKQILPWLDLSSVSNVQPILNIIGASHADIFNTMCNTILTTLYPSITGPRPLREAEDLLEVLQLRDNSGEEMMRKILSEPPRGLISFQ